MKLPGLLDCALPRAAIKTNYNASIHTAVKNSCTSRKKHEFSGNMYLI